MQDLSRLRLNDIRELEEVLTTLLKWEERLVARGATQQSRYEGDSYRRGDARNRSEIRSNSRERRDYDRHDRRDYDRGDRRDYGRRERREQDRPREDIRRAPRVTFAEAEERDWVADLNGRRPNTRRASTRRDVWSDSKDGGSSAGDFESSCSDDSSSDDDQRQLVAANESERRSAGEGTSTAMLPGETTLTLLKSKKMEANPVGRREVPCRSPRGLRVEAHGCADFSLQKSRPPAETHARWVRRTEKLIPTLLSNRRGDLAKVRLTNVADRDTTCGVFTDFVV
ncbi:hypothetical protein PC123_g22579 [Phytophthora cactorum]|nr:hypothetical protein PC123_g22579 [Phytophthora cactorum]